jgi:uncharacterized membrane protein HdeD (DUF308 family)
MDSSIAESPAALAIRGIFALLFGIIALLLPVSAFFALVLVFGAYALADGVSALIAAIRRRDSDGRGWLVVEAITGIIAGVLTFVWPAITAVALIALVTAWAFVTGVMKIILAIRLRREIKGEWLLALSGVASILLAVLLLARPLAATLALIWSLGIYALVISGLLIALSFRVRNHERSLREPTEPSARAA